MKVQDPAIEKLKIKAITPKIFWKVCNKCKMQYKQTPMWSYLRIKPNEVFKTYICMNCINNYDELLDYIFFEGKYKPKPPKGWK